MDLTEPLSRREFLEFLEIDPSFLWMAILLALDVLPPPTIDPNDIKNAYNES